MKWKSSDNGFLKTRFVDTFAKMWLCEEVHAVYTGARFWRFRGLENQRQIDQEIYTNHIKSMSEKIEKYWKMEQKWSQHGNQNQHKIYEKSCPGASWAHFALFGSSWAPFPLFQIDSGTIFIDFRHFFPSNSSGRVQAKTKNPRALRPGGPPQKTVSAIDQSHRLRPDGLRRSIIPGTVAGLRGSATG